MKKYNDEEFAQYVLDVATGYEFAGVYDEIEFAGVLMAQHDEPQEIAYEIVSEIPSFISNYLTNANPANGEALLDAIKEAAVNYYQDKMLDLISKSMSQEHSELAEDAGLESYIDPVDGELLWRKK